MRAVIQRVTNSKVCVKNQMIAQIGKGLMILLGVEVGDDKNDALYLARKIAKMRIFSDNEGKLNLSVLDIQGEILAVSQFTLCANAHNGNRPSFTRAMKYEDGKILYELFVEFLRNEGVKVSCGVYGADMQVMIENDGPVTILLDSKKTF